MQPNIEKATGSPRTGASQRRRGGPRTDGGRSGRADGGQKKKTSSRRGLQHAHSQSMSQKGAVFPPINMSSVRSTPPTIVGSISQTPRVTTGVSFKDVLTSRSRTIDQTHAVTKAKEVERLHQMPRENVASAGGGQAAVPRSASPTPHPRAEDPLRTQRKDLNFRNTPIPAAISRVEKETVAVGGDVDLLALSHAVLNGCRLLETPKMIIDMLEVHEQNLRTRRGRRTTSTSSPSASLSAPLPADAMAIMARIKDKISMCDDLMIESI